MLCRTVFSTEEVTTTKTNTNTSASNCETVPTQILKTEGNPHLLDHILGAEATVVTSANAIDDIACAPQQEESFTMSENDNTQQTPQTPPRIGTYRNEISISTLIKLKLIAALSREERDKYKCLYYLVETAMAVRQNDCDQVEDLAHMGNYLN